MQLAHWSPTDELDVGKRVFESVEVLGRRDDKLPTVNIHWLPIEVVQDEAGVVHVCQQAELVHE